MPSLKDELGAPDATVRRLRRIVVALIAALAVVTVALYARAARRSNRVALADAAKPVTTLRARSGNFQTVRTYVGTVEAWNEAKVGPQYVSAYVDTVLVRPGASVRRGEVLATLDCRNASAASRETAARARGLAQRQEAYQHEAARLKEMLDGGFASRNEVEQHRATAASEKGEVESLRATLTARRLEVDDCILRAPFDGDVIGRFADPGAYVHPGNPIVAIADRSTMRIVADAPEADFSVVAPGAKVGVRVEAAQAKLQAPISRRTPATNRSTRTVHFEVDYADSEHALPAGATALFAVPAGAPRPATLLPLSAATVRGDHATLFVVENGHARELTVPVVGEANGTLYVAKALAPGSEIVVEGRHQLATGDAVAAKESAAQR